ncbi:MAG: formylglycine-generating enzyme family protein [Holophagales bacterium]|nr:formylglycine-generating enzyme family protein [Holophagales bacterium]
MGAGPDEGRDGPRMEDEHPRHRVTLSAFMIATHETTNAEYRRLVPEHGGGDGLPAVRMTWYEAYTYAAWLGGRLPTEAEWEYAARSSCAHRRCKRDGSKASVGEVAWWQGNAVNEVGDLAPQPVMRLEPNPWGLYDIYGNVWEWTADWYGGYAGAPLVDPPGPTTGLTSYTAARTARGGSCAFVKEWLVASARLPSEPDFEVEVTGLRVVIPGQASDQDHPREIGDPG